MRTHLLLYLKPLATVCKVTYSNKSVRLQQQISLNTATKIKKAAGCYTCGFA
jgi:hypothetical protein